VDDVVRPNFKQHKFAIPGAKPFTSETARAASEKSRAMRSVKEALLNAFDKLGNEAFFVQLGRGSAEDKRCLANILAKLLPIEVAGSLDATMTVRVVTMLGDEIEIARPIPKDATPLPALPAALGEGRAPEDG